jgi:hypothetical protein
MLCRWETRDDGVVVEVPLLLVDHPSKARVVALEVQLLTARATIKDTTTAATTLPTDPFDHLTLLQAEEEGEEEQAMALTSSLALSSVKGRRMMPKWLLLKLGLERLPQWQQRMQQGMHQVSDCF